MNHLACDSRLTKMTNYILATVDYNLQTTNYSLDSRNTIENCLKGNNNVGLWPKVLTSEVVYQFHFFSKYLFDYKDGYF